MNRTSSVNDFSKEVIQIPVCVRPLIRCHPLIGHKLSTLRKIHLRNLHVRFITKYCVEHANIRKILNKCWHLLLVDDKVKIVSPPAAYFHSIYGGLWAPLLSFFNYLTYLDKWFSQYTLIDNLLWRTVLHIFYSILLIWYIWSYWIIVFICYFYICIQQNFTAISSDKLCLFIDYLYFSFFKVPYLWNPSEEAVDFLICPAKRIKNLSVGFFMCPWDS